MPISTTSPIIKIDRSKPLDLITLIGKEAVDDGCVVDSQDARSLAKTEFDSRLVRFEEGRRQGEFNVFSGQVILDRLTGMGRIMLDAQFFEQTFLDPRYEKVPEDWRHWGPCELTHHIYCYGTIFRNRYGKRFVAGWVWEDWTNGTWKRPGFAYLHQLGFINHPAVTLCGEPRTPLDVT